LSILSRKYLGFDGDDVRVMQEMMGKFQELHAGTGMHETAMDSD
jgi:hypothetical protein